MKQILQPNNQHHYERIKEYLLKQIEQGTLVPGVKVASENQLAEQFSVSRMTARRALDDLSESGFLFRSQGLGTFVADSRPMSSILKIRNIADEIRERGNDCNIKVLRLTKIIATEEQASQLGLLHPSQIFHSILVYFENKQPIQFESRYVNPILAPNYIEQNYTTTTPNVYLSQVAPLTEADHIVEAAFPEPIAGHAVDQHLNIASTQPCLKITRRTFSHKGIVSMATLIHPGDRYRLGGHIHIKPKNL